MIKKLIITLFATFCCAFSLVMGQAQEKSPQDIQKEKGWSGSQMPSWVFLSIGAFIL